MLWRWSFLYDYNSLDVWDFCNNQIQLDVFHQLLPGRELNKLGTAVPSCWGNKGG